MKTSFLIMAIRCICMVANTIDRSITGVKYLLREQVINFSKITSRYHWLKLTTEKSSSLEIKNSEPIEKLFQELKELMIAYPELEGFDLQSGDPFVLLTQSRGLTADEIVQQHGENVICVRVDSLPEITEALMRYNFFHKHRKLFANEFTQAEDIMRGIAKRDRYPARGSWNAFVPNKEVKKKKKRDLSCLSEFGIVPTAKALELAPKDSKAE